MQAIGRVGASADVIHSVYRTASLIRTTWVGAALALASFVGTQAAAAQAAGPIAQLMPLISEEEEELDRADMQNMLRLMKAAGQLPEVLDSATDQPKPTRQQSRINHLSRMTEALEGDYPATRTIPEGKIVEVSVSVRLPDGKTIGPYRMYSSLAPGYTNYEFATGMDYAVPSKLLFPPNGGFPDIKNIDISDMMSFKADGDERFIGAVLGNLGADGTIGMNLALIVDGQPMRIVRAAARSGASAQVSAPGGHLFTIKPVLRSQTKIEARWNGQKKQEMAMNANSPLSHYPASVRRINPEWPGPMHVRTGPLYLRAFKNAQFQCGEWKSKFSNDPAVDIRRLGASPVTIRFDADGRPQISVPSPPGAFDANAFPAGLASEQTADRQMSPTGFNHLGRSPALADVLDFKYLERPSSSAVWERIRRDDGIIYRTRFFLRCRKQGS